MVFSQLTYLPILSLKSSFIKAFTSSCLSSSVFLIIPLTFASFPVNAKNLPSPYISTPFPLRLPFSRLPFARIWIPSPLWLISV